MSHTTTFAVFASRPVAEQRFWGVEGRSEADMLAIAALADKFAGLPPQERAAYAKYFVSFRYPGDQPTRYGINNNARTLHYLPTETDTSEGCGAWQSDSTAKWHFVDKGLRATVRKILTWMRRGDRESGLIATGGLLHFLQDQTSFFHCLEGEEGGSQWMLDELIEPPTGHRTTPTSLLHEQTPKIDLNDYQPRLLGATLEETCFHLYQRYRRVKYRNRLNLIPLVQAQYANQKRKEAAIRKTIGRNTAELTADVIYTLYCMVTSQYAPASLRALDQVNLSELKPVNYPRHLCVPYRFNTLVKDYALDMQAQPCALELRLRTRRGFAKRRFETGLGMGCHRYVVIAYPVPKGVFRRLEGYVGLHAELGQDGQVDCEVGLSRHPKQRVSLNRQRPSFRLDQDMRAGGLLMFVFRGKPVWNNPANNIVLGEPRLVKS